MARSARVQLLFALSITLMIGCAERETTKGTSGAKGNSPSAPPPASSSNDVRLESVSVAQWDQALATHKGKIVVVDTWATTCIPCVEEFPQLVALHGKYAADGVVCMSVSVDEKTDRDAAHDFLKKQKATFPNYFIDDPKEQAWWDKWKIGAIPVVLVFDREGKLARKFDIDDPDNQFTYEDVEKLVAELVKPRG
jgi:thiol-disulfide isomerase/thioredoxin